MSMCRYCRKRPDRGDGFCDNTHRDAFMSNGGKPYVPAFDVVKIASRLADVMGMPTTSNHVAPSMTCEEVDAMARLFMAVDRYDVAYQWVYAHCENDEDPADKHTGMDAVRYVDCILVSEL